MTVICDMCGQSFVISGFDEVEMEESHEVFCSRCSADEYDD
jgi:uncharacterized Zn-finger protein